MKSQPTHCAVHLNASEAAFSAGFKSRKDEGQKAIHQGDQEKQSVNFFNSHKAHFLSIVHKGLCTGTNWTRICNKSPNDNPMPELTSPQSGTNFGYCFGSA